ncbi:PhzF family phenazine biosynthesis protein [Heyndrickxia ginsengihumi]|nr:PhzF family phenazine biosynthesis isomerase [Heyndrickxia ginsengihumi]
MREICINHIDAFTTKRFAGNPAGVVLNAECLSTQEMQQIANELNLSETVFLLPPQTVENDFRVKYFTPKEEIDFCGHATVALTWLVATEMGLAQTKHGIV